MSMPNYMFTVDRPLTLEEVTARGFLTANVEMTELELDVVELVLREALGNRENFPLRSELRKGIVALQRRLKEQLATIRKSNKQLRYED